MFPAENDKKKPLSTKQQKTTKLKEYESSTVIGYLRNRRLQTREEGSSTSTMFSPSSEEGSSNGTRKHRRIWEDIRNYQLDSSDGDSDYEEPDFEASSWCPSM